MTCSRVNITFTFTEGRTLTEMFNNRVLIISGLERENSPALGGGYSLKSFTKCHEGYQMKAYMGRACCRHGGEKCLRYEIGTREGTRLHGSLMRRRNFDVLLEELSVRGGGLESSVSVQTPWLSVVKTASKWRDISGDE